MFWFHVIVTRKSYAHDIEPIPNIGKCYEDSSSLGIVMKPPLTKRLSGGPRTIRMKYVIEGSKRRPIKYGRCGVVGRVMARTLA